MKFIIVEDNVLHLDYFEGAQGDREPKVDQAHDVEGVQQGRPQHNVDGHYYWYQIQKYSNLEGNPISDYFMDC